MKEIQDLPARRCPFCRMPTRLRFAGLPVCAICRDQLHDFLWASAVQVVVTLVFALGGLFFLVEEVLLFAVLVFVKHRLRPPWERPT